MKRILATTLLACAVGSALADPKDFSIDVKPVFQGQTIWQSAPLIVDLGNKGPDAKGTLMVSGGSDKVQYPVDLPRGAQKRVMVFPSGARYGGAPELVLNTDRERIAIEPTNLRNSYGYGGQTFVALVSDHPGEMAFLRQSSKSRTGGPSMYYDCYVNPEDVPVRPAGLAGCAGLVLGQGSERLSDDSIRAIKLYAFTGGTVIFLGGASSPALSDPRWQDLVPIANAKVRTIPGSSTLTRLASQPQSESLTVSAGTALKGSKVRTENGVPLIVERPFGMGKAVFLAFDPFEEPLTAWGGRYRLFQLLISGASFQRATQYLDQFGIAGDFADYPPPPSVSSLRRPNQELGDPFSVTMPPASRVFWTLAAFFLLVVPVNFFVMRKVLKRGEWAWLTSPLISIAFAGVFLSQASDLYGSKLSTATSGVLLAQSGHKEAVFTGNTQMFFPTGGTYDLKLSNVDQLGMGRSDYYEPFETSRTQVDALDVGEIVVPNLRAANLAFEQIDYRQIVPGGNLMEIERISSGTHGTKLRLENRSRSALHSISIVARGFRLSVADIAAGQSRDITIPKVISTDPRNMDTLMLQTRNANVVIVTASIDSIRPGPQIGNEVAGRTNILLTYFSQPGILEEDR